MVPLLSFAGVRSGCERGGRRDSTLVDVNFDLHAGETLGVYGKRRAGKTTLLLMAAGLELAGAGSVRFDGSDLKDMSDRDLAALRRTQIGWVQHEPPRMHLRVGEWIALQADPDHSDREAHRDAQQALDRVGVGDCAETLCRDLSDAERTLAGIAGALVRNPRLLVADDPARALDADERERTMLMLRRLADERGIAMLIAAPDLATIAYAKRTGTLSGGELIINDDQPADVIDIRERRRALGL
jgi:ABC-type lipoprotein export system ATPase subunit